MSQLLGKNEVPGPFYLRARGALDEKYEVADQAAREAIPTEDRYEGMLVYQIDTALQYILRGPGTTNTSWEINEGSATPSSGVTDDVQLADGAGGFAATVAFNYDRVNHNIKAGDGSSFNGGNDSAVFGGNNVIDLITNPGAGNNFINGADNTITGGG